MGEGEVRGHVRFALIVHDVFPMEDSSFIDKLGDRNFYGVERIREDSWYVWPGWCIFRYNDILHGDCVQLINHTWLHLINGSNCARIPGKEGLVNRMIVDVERLYEVVNGGEKA